MNSKKQISIMMIILIVLLPISIAETSDLQLVRYSGEDEANGFARSKDTLTIKAKAMLLNENILPSRVNFWIGNVFAPFDTCQKGTDDYYTCTYTDELDLIGQEKIDFKVTLHDQDTILRETLEETIIIDDTDPEIISFNVEPEMTTGPVNFAVTAKDYGTTTASAECSGIKEIIFYVNMEEVGTITGEAGECEITEGFDYIYDGDENELRACATVRDFLDGEDTACDDFYIDEGAPTIEVALTNAEGAQITHVLPGRSEQVSVRAEITDLSGIEDATVKAKLTPFNDNVQLVPYSNKQIPNFYYWTGLEVDEESSGTILVRATDNIGNQGQGTLDFDIEADDKSPVVVQIGKGPVDGDGNPIAAYNSYFTIIFSEKDTDGDPGVGMNLGKAYLNIYDLTGRSADKKLQADLCENTAADKWDCKWNIHPNFLTTNSGIYDFELSSDTQDDLGNKIDSGQEFEIFYQSEGPLKPKVIDYIVIPGPEGVGGEAVRGDTVQFVVESKNFENAFADFSAIGGESDSDAVECSLSSITGLDECLFESVVDISGPAEATINFIFTDIFDDTTETEYNMTIYELDVDTARKYWTSDVTCRPQPIDRKTTSQLPQRVVCEVDLSTSSSAETVSIIGPTSINDCIGNTTNFIDDISTINTAPGSTNPYFMIQLPARDYYLDNLSLSCPLTIYSKREQTIYTTPQEEDVDILLEFYDLPLGDIYERREKTIKEAVDTARVLKSDLLETMNEIVNIAEEVCEWKGIITSIISTGAALVAVIGNVEDSTSAIPVFGPAISQSIYLTRAPICEIEEKIDGAYGGKQSSFKKIVIPEEEKLLGVPLYTILDKACAVVNCQSSGGKDQWGIENLVGGGAPWCTAFEDWIMDQGGSLTAGWAMMQGNMRNLGEGERNMRMYTNIKDNIYLSTACLCLPGIIRNINKIAQIECKYATCLEKDWKETGVPISYCKDTNHYMNCAYVWGGPLFDIIPFSQFFEGISQMLGEMLANPWTIVTTFFGTWCDLTCETKPAQIHTACSLYRVAAEVGEAWASIAAMTNRQNEMGMVTNEWCGEMEEWAEEYDKTTASGENGGEPEYEPF